MKLTLMFSHVRDLAKGSKAHVALDDLRFISTSLSTFLNIVDELFQLYIFPAIWTGGLLSLCLFGVRHLSEN